MSKSQKNTDDQRRPFQGLRSFEEKNKSGFGGRDTEINELFALVEDLCLTVVFGKSGIGKTSLLQAGLLPELRKNFYHPIYIRIDYSSSKEPLQQVKDLLFESLVEMDPGVAPMGAASLWENMHDVDFMKGLVIPVLILDQFEEIFTLGEKNSGVKELVTELADLIENRIPASIKEKYKKKGKVVPSRYRKLSYRVILSLREDYLARLEELKKFMPSIMDNRLRVVQMTISQAMDAAMKPAGDLISKSVAEDIIKTLPGVSQSDFDLLKQKGSGDQKLKVEPFLLSLICDRINEKRIEKGLEVITSDLVSEFNVSDVIKSFYNDTTSKYGQNVEHAIEDQLLTEGGFRKLQSLDEMQSKYKISNQVIDELVSARIIRKESRDGVAYVELIHDVLAPEIKKKRDKRLEEEKELARLDAIKLERAKNRRRNKSVAFIMGALLLTFVVIVGVQTYRVNKIQDENERKARARDLIISAVSESIYEDNLRNSALISRLAYGLYKEDRDDGIHGIIDSDWKFYRIMMKSSFDFDNTRDQPKNAKFHAIIKPKNKIVDLTQQLISTPSGINERSAIVPPKPSLKGLRASALTPVIQDDGYGYLVALRDNTVRKLSLDSIINFDEKLMFEGLNVNDEARVSSMVFDPIDKRLALLRKFKIFLYGQDLERPYLVLNVPNPDSLRRYADPYLSFRPGSIVLALDKNLYRWNTKDGTPIPWPKNMKLLEWEINESDLKMDTLEKINKSVIQNNTKLKPDSTIKNENPKRQSNQNVKSATPVKGLKKSKNDALKIRYSNGGSILSLNSTIKSLAISNHGVIALAIGDKLILIDENQNEIHEISFKEWRDRNGITALGFEPEGEFLLLGDGRGSIFKIKTPENRSFKGIKVEKYFAHTKKVTDIAFKINKNPKDLPLLATASQDGSVAIWNTNNWSALSLDSAFFGFSEKAARKISFSESGGYLIVAYDNGHIIRWPSSLTKIDQLICETYGGLVETVDIEGKKKMIPADIKKLTKDKHKILESDKIYYCCNCKKIKID